MAVGMPSGVPHSSYPVDGVVCVSMQHSCRGLNACVSSHGASPIAGRRKGFGAGPVQRPQLEFFDRLVCEPADGVHLWRWARVIGPAFSMPAHARPEALTSETLPEPKGILRRGENPSPCDRPSRSAYRTQYCHGARFGSWRRMARAWVGTPVTMCPTGTGTCQSPGLRLHVYVRTQTFALPLRSPSRRPAVNCRIIVSQAPESLNRQTHTGRCLGCWEPHWSDA